jgi:hypothetical protein
MSWKPEVHVEGQWSRNGLVFATKREAEANARDLWGRWSLVRRDNGWRAVKSDEPANYRWNAAERRLIALAEEAAAS